MFLLFALQSAGHTYSSYMGAFLEEYLVVIVFTCFMRGGSVLPLPWWWGDFTCSVMVGRGILSMDGEDSSPVLLSLAIWGSGDQGIRGAEDQRIRGSGEQGIRGSGDQGIREQGIRGAGD